MNPFLEACGAKGPLRVTIEGPGMAGPVALALDAPYCVVGKAAGVDVRLNSQEVSDRHAYFQLLDGQLHGVDLGSRGGTLRDGNTFGAGWIEPGQEVRIGPYRLRFAFDTAEGPDRTPPPLEDPTFPRWTLDVLLRGVRPLQLPVATRLALVGSATDCAVRLLDPSVSTIHAGLIQTRSGVWALDLLGQGGMTVNGATVRCGPLAEGDSLLIGRTTIKLRRDGAATIATAARPAAAGIAKAPRVDQPPPSQAQADEPTLLSGVPSTSPPGRGRRAAAGEGPPLRPSPLRPSPDPHPALRATLSQGERVETRGTEPAHRQGEKVSSGQPPQGEAIIRSEPKPSPRPVPVSVEEPSPSRPPQGLKPSKPSPAHPVRRPSHAPTPAPLPARGDVPDSASEPIRESEAAAEPHHSPRIVNGSAGTSPSRGNGNGSAVAPPRKKKVEEPAPEPGSTSERRGSFRYPVSERNAQIAWWERAPEVKTRAKANASCTYTAIMARGPGFKNGMTATRDNTEVRREAVSVQTSLVSRNATTLLVDVSQSGLSLLSDEPLPSGRRVWFRLEGGRRSDWVEIVPVGDARTAQGHHFLRFAFRDSCPYDLFKTLVFEAKSRKN